MILRVLGFSGLMILVLTLPSCFKDEKSYDHDSVLDPGEVGTVVDSAGFMVEVLGSSPFDFHMSQYANGAIQPNVRCLYDPAQGYTNKVVTCVIDAKEEDLILHDMSLHYNIPHNMCKYFEMMPYYYYAFEPGFGPPVVEYTKSSTGVTVQQPASGMNFQNDQPRCKFDYSHLEPPGPTCCEGEYTKIVHDQTDGTTTTETGVKWGGKISNCIKGPASESQERDLGGYPKWTVKDVKVEGINDVYKITNPVAAGAPMIHVANFWDDAIVNPLIAISPLSNFSLWSLMDEFTPNQSLLPPVVPAPMQPLTLASPYHTFPYHVFNCTDEAHEIIATLRVAIREWNTVAEYNKWPTGNPNILGSEPAPFAMHPNNDFIDWNDPELINRQCTSDTGVGYPCGSYVGISY